MLLLDLNFKSKPAQSTDSKFGIKILEQVNREYPELPVVILSAEERLDSYADVIKIGARDFLAPKGQEKSGLTGRELMKDRLLKHGLLEDESGTIIGRSIALRKALRDARGAGRGEGTLLRGESGSGKELFARYLHRMSERAENPFKPLQLSGPEHIVQSDMFGHEKGAYTGAVEKRKGYFEIAGGGTLFLDEIADITAATQVSLLRALQERTIRRLGGNVDIKVDVHVVCATNQNLEMKVENGRFRPELLERLKPYQVRVPPLRERKEDIPLLAKALLERACKKYRVIQREPTDDAVNWLVDRDWKNSNVRELKNNIATAVLEYPDLELLEACHLESAIDAGEKQQVTLQSSADLNDREGCRPRGFEADVYDLLGMKGTGKEELRGQLERIVGIRLRLLGSFLSMCEDYCIKRDETINLTELGRLVSGQAGIKPAEAASLLKSIILNDAQIRPDILEEQPYLIEILKKIGGSRPSGQLKELLERVEKENEG